MDAFQVFFDKEPMTTSQKKDLIHVKKNTASNWLFSFLKELKNTTILVKIIKLFNFLYSFVRLKIKI
jgi:hypothetical protein